MNRDELERLAISYAEGAAHLLTQGDQGATAHAMLANTYAILASLAPPTPVEDPYSTYWYCSKHNLDARSKEDHWLHEENCSHYPKEDSNA